MLPRFDRLVEYVIAVIYTMIIVAMFAGRVSLRRERPAERSKKIARYMIVWLCYLGACVAVLRHAHVGVDYIT